MTLELTYFFLMVALVAFLIGLAKSGFGGLPGTLATPLMALVMPADQAIGLLLPVLMLGDLFAVAFLWGRWNSRLILLLLPGAVAGVTIGTYFITQAPTEILRITLGVIVLLFTLYKLVEGRLLARLNYKAQNWHGLLAGTVTGFSSALAHTGSPPVSIYLLMQEITPSVFVATSALFFFILNWIKVPYYYYAGLFDLRQLWRIAWLMPMVPLGALAGRWMSDRFNQRTFEQVIVGLLVVISLLLIFT